MIEFSSLRDMSAGLANRDFSSVELTQDHLTRIQTADSDINSFVTVNPELALACRAGGSAASGWRSTTDGGAAIRPQRHFLHRRSLNHRRLQDAEQIHSPLRCNRGRENGRSWHG